MIDHDNSLLIDPMLQTFNDTDGHPVEIDRDKVIDAYVDKPETVVIVGEDGPWHFGIEARSEIEAWLGRELGTMATIEWREGLRSPLLLCKRIGNALQVKCPHCSERKGEPVFHSHGPFPRHFFAGCDDPASPFRKTGYVLAPEQPRTREEMVKRVVRALLNRAPVHLPIDDVKRLTELIVEVAGDPRWGHRPTVEEVMRMYGIS
jgi:hypothetical protein